MSEITNAARSLLRALVTAAAAPILERLDIMSDRFSSEIAKLQADVAAQSTVIASATAAFQGLAAQIAAAEASAKSQGATDAQIAPLVAVRETLESNTASLAAAIPQNTAAAAETPADARQPATPASAPAETPAASAPADTAPAAPAPEATEPAPTSQAPAETQDGNAAAGSVVDPA